MASPLVECVPNFSEGRDTQIIDTILASVEGIPDCRLLSAEPDADYNRTVVTMAGTPNGVSEAAFQLIAAAKSNIDMANHNGNHPRLGAVDVCPFIPLRDISMAECAVLALKLGSRVAEELSVPVYHYGAAASEAGREVLSILRKEEYEGLEARLGGSGETQHSELTRWPDQGPRIWDSTISAFGAVVIGARPILVAYNVNLDESDAKVAKIAGGLVRTSGRLIKRDDGGKMRIPGMLQKVQGMGVTLESHGISQVSMNIIDVEITPLHIAYEAVKAIASDHDVEVTGSELVGLAPLSAFLTAGRWYHPSPEQATEDELVTAAIDGLGLSAIAPFIPVDRVIEWAAEKEV